MVPTATVGTVEGGNLLGKFLSASLWGNPASRPEGSASGRGFRNLCKRFHSTTSDLVVTHLPKPSGGGSLGFQR